MIGKIMRHEWRVLLREKSVWLILIVFAVTVSYATWHGVRLMNSQTTAVESFAQTQKDFLSQSRETAQAMETQLANGLKIETLPEIERGKYAFGVRQSSWIGTRGLYAALVPQPLAGLAVGQSRLLAPAVLISSGNTGGGISGIPTENPLKFFTGEFDLARVIIYLFPLLILGLTFNLLSGEKETGVLRMIFAQPLSLRDLLAGKIIVRALIVFLSAILFSVFGFLLSGIDLAASDIVWKLLLWIFVVILYGAFWFTLAVLINGLGYNSGANALILTCGWLLFIVIIPSLVNFIVTAAYPLPNQAEFITASRLAREEADKLPDAEVMSRFFAEHPEFPADADYKGDGKYYVLGHSRIEETERRMRPLREKFNHQFHLRQKAIEYSSLLSPAILTQNAFLKITGNEPERYREFLLQTEAYKAARFAFFRPKLFEITKFADANFSSADYDRIPRFLFQEETSMQSISKIALLIAELFLQSALIGFLTRRIYKTYSISN